VYGDNISQWGFCVSIIDGLFVTDRLEIPYTVVYVYVISNCVCIRYHIYMSIDSRERYAPCTIYAYTAAA